jgi:hypothetical protein
MFQAKLEDVHRALDIRPQIVEGICEGLDQ